MLLKNRNVINSKCIFSNGPYFFELKIKNSIIEINKKVKTVIKPKNKIKFIKIPI